MRAVWSFWPAPFASARADAWGTERNHLLAWVLSFECARRHHETTALVTDAVGAALLVDGLGLEFDDVSLSLDRLGDADRSWWTVGKLVAIGEQSEPFVHLDPDVFMWNALPDRLIGAAVFAQNPEAYEPGSTYYKPDLIETALTATGGWLPPEWDWYRRSGVVPRGECCGIVGGNDVRLLRHYAETGLRLIGEPRNAAGLAALPERQALTITLEQYLLAACVEHHRTPISYLFPSWAAAGDERTAVDTGFTHLIADTKREPGVVARLEQRVRRDFPDRYERCVALAGSPGTASRQAPAFAAGDRPLVA